jgi:hypothetical protein
MPLAGFETTIPEFKLAKTLRALDRAAAVADQWFGYRVYILVSSLLSSSELHSRTP